MSHGEKRLLLTIFVCTIILISAFIYVFVSSPEKKNFFQAWILGSDDSILGSVLTVASNQSYMLNLGVQNTRGYEEQCKLAVKFRNMPPLDNSTSGNASTTSSLELTEFQFFLLDNETWTKNMTFKVDYVAEGDMLNILGIEIDNSRHIVNLTSTFDYTRMGFFSQFRFELWAFNASLNDFYFTNIWVSSPFLNMTTQNPPA